jgi:predicted lipoprotein with Yx(FWY)xxD motif
MGSRGRKLAAWSTLCAGVVVAAACMRAPAASVGPRYEVRTAPVGGVGRVLVDGAGDTLYLFVPDDRSVSTCYGSCAQAWPPLLLPPGVGAARAGTGARASLLGSQPRRDGAAQVTYGGWPLYTWVGDTRPGIATGEGRNNLGGCWYAVDAAGHAVKTTPCTS